jgi:phenylacetate-CoA ligase
MVVFPVGVADIFPDMINLFPRRLEKSKGRNGARVRMWAWWNRHVLQPVVAWKNGSRHLEYLAELERRQWDSPEEIATRQWSAVQEQLHYAYAHVPYYRRRWKALGIHPSDIRQPTDLQQLPVLSKSEIRRYGTELCAEGVDRRNWRIKRTSGSTGVPLTIWIDEAAVQWKTACTLRSDQWSGWRLGERVAKVWGNPEYRHQGWRGWLRNLVLERAYYLDTLGMDRRRMLDFIVQMRRKPPALLFGHAHSLYLLADMMRRERLGGVRPKGIIATAMILHRWQRSVIEQVFDVAVTDRYGCEEVSLIACECEQHRGLHLNADSVYVEVTDIRPTATPGEVAGRLLITDLSNRAMPLIRYQIGDVVVPSSRRCPCGRGLPLIERVEGREADYVLTPQGQLISGISLTENFALHIPGAAQVQIIQESLHELRIRLVPDADFGPQSRQKIATLVEKLFGPEVDHEVELVEQIPQEASGKYRFCISRVWREAAAEISVV